MESDKTREGNYMSDEQELSCKSCWNLSEVITCEHPNGCGIKAVTPTTIMCVHNPEYIKYMNLIAPIIPDQLFLFKVNESRKELAHRKRIYGENI